MRYSDETHKKIYDLMRENHLYGEAYEDFGIFCIKVEWGDWKHDHLRLDWLMKENFNILLSAEEVTEEDGSDCYSAIHKYVLGETSTHKEETREKEFAPIMEIEVF